MGIRGQTRSACLGGCEITHSDRNQVVVHELSLGRPVKVLFASCAVLRTIPFNRTHKDIRCRGQPFSNKGPGDSLRVASPEQGATGDVSAGAKAERSPGNSTQSHSGPKPTPNQTDMRFSASKRHTISSSINGETQNVFTKEHLNISRA